MFKRKGRYGKSKKITIDGKAWDSTAEYERFINLSQMQKGGLITDLQTQVKFELVKSIKYSDSSRAKPALRYVADFSYIQDGKLVIEDIKGTMLENDPVFKIKRHLMLAIHGIEVKIIWIGKRKVKKQNLKN